MTNIKQLFLAHQAQTSNFPLMLEVSHAEGNYIVGSDQKRYLDLISGISVSALGHGNEKVKEAIKKQVDKHMHVMVYGEFVQNKPAELAAYLTGLLPKQLDCVYLVNSGAEATEVALKLSKRYTGKYKLVANQNAYHGSTHAALSLNSNEYFKQPFRPLLPGVSFITFNDLAGIEVIDDKTACVVTEVIQSEAGYVPANADFLHALRKKCDNVGALLVFDEIQSGIGKTGCMFAFEHYGVVPDILLLGKALGGGMPIGAVVTSRQILHAFTDNPILGHITTFGGHAVTAAAALAALQVVVDDNLLSDIHEKEALFRQRLTHKAIKDITGKGLMLAVSLDSFENLLKVISVCLEKGVITDWFLFANNKLRIAPPLTITKEEIAFACQIINEALQQVYDT
jgi:acetylornithine/succinyldiaminopimelate/putrescine aminotransferase